MYVGGFTVGAAGSACLNGNKGTDSKFHTLAATGGGYGACNFQPGGAGGSGGGGGLRGNYAGM
jgi:hypothetical protein